MSIVTEEDHRWMRLALAEAARGRGAVEPNPMVGAVIVRDGVLVGVGHHDRYGGPHAEVHALQEAGEAAHGATLYVTLEPCCHEGKTPPCTEAVIGSGIARVVAAMRDPFPRVSGGGFARLSDAGLTVQWGVEESEARFLNAPYLKRLSIGRPFVTAKWAMTLDGKTACHSGDSKWISNPRSRSLVHEVRGRMDGILVGINTVLLDDPELTARPGGPRCPTRIILDSTARLPVDSKLVRTARTVPVWVVVSEAAPPQRVQALQAMGVEPILLPGSGPIPIPELLDELGRRGLTNLLVEGGGRVLGAFLDAGEVDAVEVFIAPTLEGGSHSFTPFRGAGVARMTEALRLARHRVSVLDGDVSLSGQIVRPWWELTDGA
ncbi:bifunctional diaminohydroxyphosphoribosylaminopyrimidine deaminase/5-amino-6-(5-phosphoribosylamino)uracil reductase RibD [Tautonia marina]|uniref:bifunctional diaminohydroxyphosphoribosylaminopyrimidine deaminase/5-amino-6-(5-phosphoribosylamino)uracil reductase RibD n=1 Tax=Tautonia marina TaxID=2653855 RepID=UPI001F01CC39|nr:bifunctional diaminohydroxyphosphoribosylaminopyrimidine deaminase/5-amino-6-(5-phosphoribosylamino)uracil reductase RibD [Tautonia marina]